MLLGENIWSLAMERVTMKLDHIWNIIRSAWPVLGPFVGICIGAYLTTRTQRKQWVRDNKRTEYRELLTAIGDAAGKMILYYGRNPVVLTSSEQLDMWETVRATLSVIYNRLFIANEVVGLGIQHRWENAVTALRDRHDVTCFVTSMDSIMEDIRKRALKEFS
jgi:hypothetical protein